MFKPLLFLSVIFLIGCAGKQEKSLPYIDLSKFEDGIHHWNLYSEIRTQERYDSADVIGIADNLLRYQNKDGGWPKNIDWLAKLDRDSVINALSDHYRESTYDNRNTFPQIEYLASVYHYSDNDKYKTGAEKGLHYILNTQYPKGGWRGWDADAITFNDDVMTGIMNLLLDVKEERDIYSWIGNELRDSLLEAYDKGLKVILNCQIKLDGTKTAWCQQHDPVMYEPVQGRSYELPSITARESSDIVLFLMRIKDPDQATKDAIESAVKWFKKARITGYRYATIEIPERSYHETTVDFDREFVPDKNAKPVWARYYDLTNGKPFLCFRDGTVVYNLSEISFDRRIGYDWYGFWPEKVLEAYKAWTE
ncbi:pectate lyase [Saccharicrinis sp. FJH2]|uniref:pectate lyase n=1 Tax=Saccharicrinis sp. FJH65 TaxID=3344659 RepID=UPI0035F22622